MRLWWSLGIAAPLLAAAWACGNSSHQGLGPDDDAGAVLVGYDDAGAPIYVEPSSSGSGPFTSNEASVAQTGDTGPCKGGQYGGTFSGSYTSHLTGIGFPIPVIGDVNLSLNQEGSADMTCMAEGEIPEPCNMVFSLQNGIIEGTADGLFPYFCTMTGTLDCKEKVLIDGWIQCTYCVGPLADGGLACDLANGVGGTTGVGGHFAGPLNANYDYNTLAFTMGTWNGAEALAGNDGGSPGPDGGPFSNYLSDSGLYLGPTDFGGSGMWNATYGRDP
jgi:hypothetical protein